jgi:hypothetical protein
VFRDGSVSGNSFIKDDTWSVTCYPAATVAQSSGPRPMEM